MLSHDYTVWRIGTRDEIPVALMSTEHLYNALRYILNPTRMDIGKLMWCDALLSEIKKRFYEDTCSSTDYTNFLEVFLLGKAKSLT